MEEKEEKVWTRIIFAAQQIVFKSEQLVSRLAGLHASGSRQSGLVRLEASVFKCSRAFLKSLHQYKRRNNTIVVYGQ